MLLDGDWLLSWSLKGELEFWMYSGTLDLDPSFSSYACHIIISISISKGIMVHGTKCDFFCYSSFLQYC